MISVWSPWRGWKEYNKTKGPRATARSLEWNSHCRYAIVMQHFSNPVIVTNERIIIWAVLGFEEECLFFCCCFFFHYYHYTMYIVCVLLGGQDVMKERKERRILPYMGMTVNEAWPFEQTLNPVSTVGSTWNLVEIDQLISEEKVFNNIMILYMYTAYRQGKITLAE